MIWLPRERFIRTFIGFGLAKPIRFTVWSHIFRAWHRQLRLPLALRWQSIRGRCRCMSDAY